MTACKDCTYWDAFEFSDRTNTAECRRITDYAFFDKLPDDEAGIFFQVSDDHGVRLEFRSGPLFLCSHFLQKFEPVD